MTRSLATGAASVQAATADVSAAAGSDYVGIAPTTLNFADGVATQPFVVTVNGDTAVKPDETFNVLLSNASAGTTIGDGTGVGTISNDDAAVAVFSVDDVVAVETNAGATTFTFTVTRSLSAGPASVQAATADVTAAAGSDYVAIAPTTLNFADGVATQPFVVTVNGDTAVEPDETFNVLLSNASAGTTIGDGTGVGTISNDDVAVAVFSVDDVAAVETNAGTTTFTFTVTRSLATGAASVQAATADVSAAAGSDYVGIAPTTLNFADGVATQPFVVTVNGDTAVEPDETFNVLLSNASAGTTIGDGTGVGTISNDDVAVAVFSVDDVAAVETNAGTTTFTFTVTRSLATGAASVQAATADVSAAAGSDYVGVAPTTLNFADGVATQPFVVTVNGDTAVEPDETFNVLLSNASAGTTIGDGTGVGTISNDDAASTSFSGPTVTGTGTFNGTIAGGGPGCGFTGTTQLIGTPPGVAPVPATLPVADAVFPHGMLMLTLSNCTPGATVEFTFTYPQVLPAGAVFWKYGRTASSPLTPVWTQHPATIVGNQISFSITDGGAGDDDLLADGNIVDPNGPAFVRLAAPPIVAVPVNASWAWLVLVTLILALAALRMSTRAEARSVRGAP